MVMELSWFCSIRSLHPIVRVGSIASRCWTNKPAFVQHSSRERHALISQKLDFLTLLHPRFNSGTTNAVPYFILLDVRFHYCYQRKHQTKTTRQDPYTNDEQIDDATPGADVTKVKNDVKKTREN